MTKKPALHPKEEVGRSLQQVAFDIIADARSAVQGPPKTDAVAIHEVRKAIKRWRALIRMLPLGEQSEQLHTEARGLARSLSGSRDSQSALDALNDLLEGSSKDGLSARSIETITSRLEDIRKSKERAQLNAKERARQVAWLASAEEAARQWRLDAMTFTDVAEALTRTYRRGRRLIPDDWALATPEQIHELRQRVTEHRYQIELVEPLWPRMGQTWTEEAQRLRTRLGQYQDLTLLTHLIGPHQPIAAWRSRLSPLIAQRQSQHVTAGARMAARVFAESPKAFRRRLQALWRANRKVRSK
jgi:CHAD domain-containing protein